MLSCSTLIISSAWLHLQDIQISHGSIFTIELSLKSCCNLVTTSKEKIFTNIYTCLLWTIWHQCILINIVVKLNNRIFFFNFTCQSAALNDAACEIDFQYAPCQMLVNGCTKFCPYFSG